MNEGVMHEATKLVYFFGSGASDGDATLRNLLGGKGANQAVAAARVANGHFTVRFVGALGHDEHGEAALANLNRAAYYPFVSRSAKCQPALL